MTRHDRRQLTFDNLPGYQERSWRTDLQADLDGEVVRMLRKEHPGSLTLADLKDAISETAGSWTENVTGQDLSDSLVRLWCRGMAVQAQEPDGHWAGRWSLELVR